MPGEWIWGSEEGRRDWNRWDGFRKRFWLKEPPGEARLLITADAEYRVWINGAWVGQGPPRGWPDEWWVDEYEVGALLAPGENLIEVLGHSIGVSTFKYLVSDAGVRAAIVSRETVFEATGKEWECRPRIMQGKNLRISCQQGWLEPARGGEPVFGCEGWRPASVVPDSRELRLSPVRLSTQGALEAKQIASLKVRPPQVSVAIGLRELLLPASLDAAPKQISGIVGIRFESKSDQTLQFEFAKDWFWVAPNIKLNGIPCERVTPNRSPWEGGAAFAGRAKPGENVLLLEAAGTFHDWTIGLSLDQGDIQLSPEIICAGPLSSEERARLWETADYEQIRSHPAAKTVPQAALEFDWAFGRTAYAQEDDQGSTARKLYDFGRMTVGTWEIELEAAEPETVLLNGLEAFQDGQPDFAWEMSNTLALQLKPGKNRIRSLIRRGGRYVVVDSRNAQVLSLKSHESTFPSQLAVPFRCSDPQLERIFEMCALTLRLCSEDTFVDCPTYEQTFWVGDSRIECAVNYTLFGDYELCKRCLRLAAGSLRRSDFVESHVPSGWQSVIPAWSALWAMAVADSTDVLNDPEFPGEMHTPMMKQIAAFENSLDERGLFSIEAWNLTDWSAMDQPNKGVTTANQAWAALAAKAAIKICRLVGDSTGEDRCRRLISTITKAANGHLWVDQRQAFSDCINPETGALSDVFSAQTHCLMALAEIAAPERMGRSVQIALDSTRDEGFVQVGTPYFMFFIFELLDRLGRYPQILERSREKWGAMLQAGSTTCWEVFPGFMHGGRNTRSTCHAWSTAPAYFFIRSLLGIRPISPQKYVFSPNPCGVEWCSGGHPTPWGPIRAEWTTANGRIEYQLDAPAEVELRVALNEL